MISFEQFESNLASVRARILKACQVAGRSGDSVMLLPVTKNYPIDAVNYAVRCGLSAVGESRVQEAVDKHVENTTAVRWEMVGHLQSNKAKEAVTIFDRIQSIESIKLLKKLDCMAKEKGRCLPILLQCNTGADPDKYGFSNTQVSLALETALGASGLQVDGLMTIAPLSQDREVAKRAFEGLRELRDTLVCSFGVPLKELSMGMTGDLEMAIAAGSTQVRVGTALYGVRSQ